MAATMAGESGKTVADLWDQDGDLCVRKNLNPHLVVMKSAKDCD